MPEFADNRAEGIASGGQPILMTCATPAVALLDDPFVRQFAQPRDQHCARNQGDAAMDVVERMGPCHQFAQDKRCPAIGKDLGCLGDRTELAVARLHTAIEPALR